MVPFNLYMPSISIFSAARELVNPRIFQNKKFGHLQRKRQSFLRVIFWPYVLVILVIFLEIGENSNSSTLRRKVENNICYWNY